MSNNGNLTEKAAIKSPHAHRLTERVAALNKSCESMVQSRVQSTVQSSPKSRYCRDPGKAFINGCSLKSINREMFSVGLSQEETIGRSPI